MRKALKSVSVGKNKVEEWRVFMEKVRRGQLLGKKDAVTFRQLCLLFSESKGWQPILERARGLFPKERR